MKRLVGYNLSSIYVFESRKAAIQQAFTSSGISRALSRPGSTHCGLLFGMRTQEEIDHLAAALGLKVVEVKEAQA